MKIAVAGTGYVGLSNAVLLAQHNDVRAYDIDASRVDAINRRASPLADPDIQAFFAQRQLRLSATLDVDEAFREADYVIVATPTDYDVHTDSFDTRSVEALARTVIDINPAAQVVIKSTVPVGFTRRLRDELKHSRIMFSPEFLREGRALHDNLHPSRIIVGAHGEAAEAFGRLMQEGALRQDVAVLHTESSEAEAIKLFSNTYLAMRVAFFNELDTYAQTKGLDTRQIIEGIGLDPRIGLHYNNPSFGYGGYCLPKDTRQLLANYADVPNCLMRAIVDANAMRKQFILQSVLAHQPGTVGVFRLVMKAGADNFRESAVHEIMRGLRQHGVEVLVHEPSVTHQSYMDCEVVADVVEFKRRSEIIIANRWYEQLADVAGKVYTRDVFGSD